jgi:hypothetical protein
MWGTKGINPLGLEQQPGHSTKVPTWTSFSIVKGMFCVKPACASTYQGMPAWKPLADPRIANSTEPVLGGEAWKKIVSDGMSDTVNAIQNVHDFDVSPIIDDAWTKMMAGKMGPEEFLSSTDKAIADLGIPLAKG